MMNNIWPRLNEAGPVQAVNFKAYDGSSFHMNEDKSGVSTKCYLRCKLWWRVYVGWMKWLMNSTPSVHTKIMTQPIIKLRRTWETIPITIKAIFILWRGPGSLHRQNIRSYVMGYIRLTDRCLSRNDDKLWNVSKKLMFSKINSARQWIQLHSVYIHMHYIYRKVSNIRRAICQN